MGDVRAAGSYSLFHGRRGVWDMTDLNPAGGTSYVVGPVMRSRPSTCRMPLGRFL